MEKTKESVLQEDAHTEAAVSNPSAGYPSQPGYPHGGPPTDVPAGYPAQPAGVVVLPLTVGPDPCTVVCPACHRTVQTEVRDVPTTNTRSGYCFCFCIPYCVVSMKAKHHYCPKCAAFIAAYDK